MIRRIKLQLLLCTALSCPALAQVPSSPPPWFSLGEELQDAENTNNDALPRIEDILDPQEEEAPSALEKLYQERLPDAPRQFGYDLFDQNIKETASLSTPNGSVQDDYILASGDELHITFTGQRNDQGTYKIDPSGIILIKDFAPINAVGLSISDLRESVNRKTAEMPNTQAYISLSAIKQIGVLVIGHVNDPGLKTMNAFNTVLDALRAGGGVQKQGSLRNIKLIRRGNSTQIDLYSLMMNEPMKTDIMLRDGDRIVIPPIGPTLAIAGDVKRPGIFEISDQKLTLNQALALSGGALSSGQNRFMHISTNKTGEDNVEEISNYEKSVFQNGSILSVNRSINQKTDSIELTGHTRKPGLYSLSKTGNLSDLLNDQTVFFSDTYPLIGIIQRHDKTTLSSKFIPFSISSVLNKKTDIKLQESDKVVLLSNEYISSVYNKKINDTDKAEKSITLIKKMGNFVENDDLLELFLKEQSLYLRGAVRKPGPYPVAKGVTLESLLAAAGGLALDANLDNVEIISKALGQNLGDEPQTQTFRTSLSINPQASEYTHPQEIALSPGDAVRINQKHQKVKENSVLIIGEVLYPGEYDLLPGDTVSSLMERAGGLTEQSYPSGTIFSRESERRAEQLNNLTTARNLERQLAVSIEKDKNPPNPDQIEMVRNLAQELSTIQTVGRITVETDPAILSVNPELDMLLENGDKIYIPKRPLTVRVRGEVFSPAALQFRKDKDPIDYIREAGGFTKTADKNRAFVLYPDGSAEPLKVSAWNHTPIFIPPGSTIIVPLDPKPFKFLESAKEVGQIIGNLAVTAVFIDDIKD